MKYELYPSPGDITIRFVLNCPVCEGDLEMLISPEPTVNTEYTYYNFVPKCFCPKCKWIEDNEWGEPAPIVRIPFRNTRCIKK